MFSNTGTPEPMITLHLPLAQVNIVLAGLGELPLKVSRPVSEVIENQARADVQRQQEFMRMQRESHQTQPPSPQEASKEAGAQATPIQE